MQKRTILDAGVALLFWPGRVLAQTRKDESSGEAKESGSGSPLAPTRKIRDLTGTSTSSGKFGVGGTDLGIPVRQPDGLIAYIFGDTFESDTVGGSGWRSPVLLRSKPGLPTQGIEFSSAAGGAYAKQILEYSHRSGLYSTWLPNDVITIGRRMYLHYKVVKGLQNTLWSSIAFSDDNGENWIESGVRWEGQEDGGLRQQWSWERGGDGWVYVVSSSARRSQSGIFCWRIHGRPASRA